MSDGLKFLRSNRKAGYVEKIYCSDECFSMANPIPFFAQDKIASELEVKVHGRRKVDFMFFSGVVTFISKRVHDAFGEVNLKNYRVVPVKGSVLEGYSAIVPSFCLARREGLVIERPSWDGSDFCSDTDAFRTMASSRVVDLILKNKFTGVNFTDVELI